MTDLPMPSRRSLTALVAAPFIVAACTTTSGGDAALTPEARLAAATTSGATAAPGTAEATTATEESPGPAPGAVESEVPGATTWLDIELTDAESGETFTLASLAGSVVALEPMAIWCPTCKSQQDNVRQAYADIEAAGARFISLGVDPNEGADSLANYAERNGYEWTFARSPEEFSRALNDLFGAQVLSPPSTPLIVLDTAGEVVVQEFGQHGPDKLLGFIEEAAGA